MDQAAAGRELLTEVPLLAGVDPATLDELARLARSVHVHAGDDVVRQGEPGDCLSSGAAAGSGASSRTRAGVALREFSAPDRAADAGRDAMRSSLESGGAKTLREHLAGAV